MLKLARPHRLPSFDKLGPKPGGVGLFYEDNAGSPDTGDGLIGPESNTHCAQFNYSGLNVGDPVRDVLEPWAMLFEESLYTSLASWFQELQKDAVKVRKDGVDIE